MTTRFGPLLPPPRSPPLHPHLICSHHACPGKALCMAVLVWRRLHPLTSLREGARPFPFVPRQGATGEDALAAVTAGALRHGCTGRERWSHFQGGHPMALASSLLLASGERQTRGEVQAKALVKDSYSPEAPLPPLFGGLMCWGGQSCPFPSLLCMCTCLTWLGILVCPLGKPG